MRPGEGGEALHTSDVGGSHQHPGEPLEIQEVSHIPDSDPAVLSIHHGNEDCLEADTAPVGHVEFWTAQNSGQGDTTVVRAVSHGCE